MHLSLDIGLCVVIATALAYAAKWLRQPFILAYIAAGVLLGPIGFNRIQETHAMEDLANLGLAFLLFIVGLEIDLKKLLATGWAAGLAAVVQVVVSAVLGALAAHLMGFKGMPAAYIGAAMAFSSTMIVVKMLADRSELDTLPGHITLGILLLQDVLAIVVLAIQPNLGGEGGFPMRAILLSVVKGFALVAGALLLARYVLPLAFRSIAKVPEIVLLSAITWCFLVCYAAAKADFSIAMGALIAGVSMSTYPYSLDVITKIRSLRDFFVTLFFVSLGTLMQVPTLSVVITMIALTVLTILTRVITIWPVLGRMGYDNRAGLLSSLHLAQISEFGLVIALVGITSKHITHDIVSLIVMLLVVTSTVSAYLIKYSHGIVSFFTRQDSHVAAESRQHGAQGGDAHGKPLAPVVLLGCFRVGSSLTHELIQAGLQFSVIDFNPVVLNRLRTMGVDAVYGDISHPDVLEHLHIQSAKVIVVAISDDFLRGTDNHRLLAALRRLAPDAMVMVTAESLETALQLYREGAAYVLLPRLLSAGRLLEIIKASQNGGLNPLREQEMAALKARKEALP